MAKRIRFAYRMTHIDNIQDILNVGIVLPGSPHANPNFVPIGDPTAIETRNRKYLNDASCIGDYIPFYLGPRTPMLYVIQHGYNSVKRYAPSEIVYCVIDIEDIIKDNVDCVFTDGHALSLITRVFPREFLSDIDQYVSYQDVYTRNWLEAPDLKRRKEAELLIKQDLPVGYIKYYVVYDELAKNRLVSFGIDEAIVKIFKPFYF